MISSRIWAGKLTRYPTVSYRDAELQVLLIRAEAFEEILRHLPNSRIKRTYEEVAATWRAEAEAENMHTPAHNDVGY